VTPATARAYTSRTIPAFSAHVPRVSASSGIGILTRKGSSRRAGRGGIDVCGREVTTIRPRPQGAILVKKDKED